MKINEIPEKIYLDYELDEDKIHIFINYMWHRHPFEGKNLTNVENTLTDGFIERVINFLNYKLDDVVATRLAGTIIPHHVAKQELIEDCKKFMKGE